MPDPAGAFPLQPLVEDSEMSRRLRLLHWLDVSGEKLAEYDR